MCVGERPLAINSSWHSGTGSLTFSVTVPGDRPADGGHHEAASSTAVEAAAARIRDAQKELDRKETILKTWTEQQKKRIHDETEELEAKRRAIEVERKEAIAYVNG